MARVFSVGAIAIASRGANAVGAVRLTCAPEGLTIDLLRAGSFASGFAMGGVVDAARVQVPFVAVRGLVRRGRTLHLALDPSVARPYSRFALTRFGAFPIDALLGSYRARARARIAAAVLPLPIGAIAAWFARAMMPLTAVMAALVGAAFALGSLLLLHELVKWRTWGGPLSDRYRDAFEIALSQRLGLLPAPPADESIFDPVPLAPEPGLPPWVRLASIITVLSLGAVAGAAFVQRFSEPAVVPARVAMATAGVAAAAGSIVTEGLIVLPPPLPSCVCARADSPLWSDGLPALSILTSPRDEEAASASELSSAPGVGGIAVAAHPDDDERMRFDFEVSAINNASRSVHDVRVVVTFARRDRSGNRIGANDRGLFWEGALGAGRAVKWSVGGPGTEVRIDRDDLGFIEGAPPRDRKGRPREPAPADRFFELLSARMPIVRMHGAKMLAFLGDPRAASAAAGLSTASRVEEALRAQIARATRGWIACEITSEGDEVSMCVFNRSTAPLRSAEIREVDEPARRFRLDREVGVHEGVRARFPLKGTGPPTEVVVEAGG